MSIESNEIEMFRDIQGWWHLHICRNIAGVADFQYLKSIDVDYRISLEVIAFSLYCVAS